MYGRLLQFADPKQFRGKPLTPLRTTEQCSMWCETRQFSLLKYPNRSNARTPTRNIVSQPGMVAATPVQG